mmetsp:Transcript_33445/g.84730  ORF Transcript_33445/g.84730 Transcript_33445/m.84730 type:complete len:274 (+) Transcript_33445:61-882(+)
MAREIAAPSYGTIAGRALFGILIQVAHGQAQQTQTLKLWPTPPQLVGRCSTVWTSSVGKYDLPYRVDFGDAGSFRWWAPMLLGGVELGSGVFLSAPRTTVNDDGSWEVGYFGANRFVPDPANSTNCCCEYVGQAGPNQPRILADYCVAGVPNTAHLPMQEVCAQYVRQCPENNATALKTMGKPFIEIYSPCVALGGVAWVGWPSAIAALVTMFVVLQVALAIRAKLGMHADAAFDEIEEGYHTMEAPFWLRTIFKTKAAHARTMVHAATSDSV